MERFHRFWEKAREVSSKDQSEPLRTVYRAQNVNLDNGWFLEDFEEETLPNRGSWFSIDLIAPDKKDVSIFWDEYLGKFDIRGPKEWVTYLREEANNNQAF